MLRLNSQIAGALGAQPVWMDGTKLPAFLDARSEPRWRCIRSISRGIARASRTESHVAKHVPAVQRQSRRDENPWMRRIHASGRLALACLLVAAASACRERWQTTHELSALRVVQYWSANKLDWEGGNTCVERVTLCERDSGRCRETPGLSIEPDTWEFFPARWILATWGDPQTPHFFDTETARELPCFGCRPALTSERRSALAWSSSGSDAVAVFADRGANRLVVRSFHFTPSAVEVRSIDSGAAPVGMAHPPLISPDGSAIAWLSCRDTCDVASVEIASGRFEVKPTGCPDHGYLELRWKGSEPQAQYHWGAALGDTRATLCRDASGEVALPFGPD